MTPDEPSAAAPVLPMGWRLKAGMVLFPLALIPYGLLAPLVFYKLPAATIATMVAVGVILQKVLFVAAVTLLGKAGFAVLKAKLFHKLTPPAEVGPARYRVGLVMFCLPLVLSFLETALSHATPHLVANRLWVDVALDAMLVASVFVLGGNFWEKLRALFVADARAVFPKGDEGRDVVGRPAIA